MMTDGRDDRAEWARKFLHPDDVDEIEFKSDRFIAFEQPAVHLSIDLSINEAIRMCRAWDEAIEGNHDKKKQFLSAINGAMDYIAQCLEDMDIDYTGELIDDDYDDEE
jgi:hypothetical protein